MKRGVTRLEEWLWVSRMTFHQSLGVQPGCHAPPPHREKKLVESKLMWFIYVLTYVLSCRKLLNEINQLTKRIRETF